MARSLLALQANPEIGTAHPDGALDPIELSHGNNGSSVQSTSQFLEIEPGVDRWADQVARDAHA
ncbi:MAG: hypothetical protein RL885_12745 [Planctomycetota bacterium]